MEPADLEVLLPLLRDAQALGLVGPGSLNPHLDHLLGFAEVAGRARVGLSDAGSPGGTDPGGIDPGGIDPGAMLLDLGSGAGLPGLGLALLWPTSRWLLLDGRVRSTRFLAGAARRLGLDDRVHVVEGRAEVVAHAPHQRSAMDLVVARSVSSPAVVAECAAGFLRPGGTLVVSEPPDASALRWEEGALTRLGMGPARSVESTGGFHFTVVEQREPCPSRYPRRTGIPSKRPLF